MSKYVTLSDFLTYSPVTVASANDNTTLQAALNWAEGEFERLAGSQFDQGTQTNEYPTASWVDRNGGIYLIARTRGPVTAVSGVQYRYAGAGFTWTDIGWDASNGIILTGGSEAPPRPDAWQVVIYPSSVELAPAAMDNILLRWSYTGGYASTPDALNMLIKRLAWWKYKLREAPLGKVASPPFGITEVIPSMPADIGRDIGLWQKRAMG